MPLNLLSVEYDSGSNQFVRRTYPSTPNNGSSMRQIIGCTELTSIEVEVNGKFFEVFSDGEALYKPRPVPNLCLGYSIICGNIVFAKIDDEGYTIGLTKKEIDAVWKYYLSCVPALFQYLANIDDLMLRIAINQHVLPIISGVYKEFCNVFKCPGVYDGHFKTFNCGYVL